MKYRNRQPSTEPEDAINAYSGMRAGCWMESSISSRSLITGNVSTEESRNEIKNNPGAPNAPANATIFAFHALSFPPKLSPLALPPSEVLLIRSTC
jgi:hypothetical protein